MTGDIRWGILGVGRMAAAMTADIALTDGNRVVGIASRDLTRAEALTGGIAAARAYGSYRALIEDRSIDVIYIATVNSEHYAHAMLALEAGKNVVVEKPLCVTSPEARRVVAKARQQGVFCMEGMWMRMQPLVRSALRAVGAGAIGHVTAVRGELSTAHPFDPTSRLYNPAVGGGVLLDLGIYPAHLTWQLLGRPDTIHATGTQAPSGVDDSATMQWDYNNGPVAHLASSFRQASTTGAVIDGTKGSIRIGPRLNRPRTLTISRVTAGTSLEKDRTSGHGYQPEIAEVARCIRTELHESPLAPLDESVGILTVLDHARRHLGVE